MSDYRIFVNDQKLPLDAVSTGGRGTPLYVEMSTPPAGDTGGEKA